MDVRRVVRNNQVLSVDGSDCGATLKRIVITLLEASSTRAYGEQKLVGVRDIFAACGRQVDVAVRLEPVSLNHLYSSDELLAFFMGKNTPERQDFIIDNLRIEKDLVETK